jgi:hypothetical protein
MKQRVLFVAVLLVVAVDLRAHDPSGAPITWNREISRIVYERCASCHREGGSSFSLMTFQEAQPYASAIKDSVLARRMPPWGAVKGFGDFRNDTGLTQEQIGLVADWVEGGITRGNNPKSLPPIPKFETPAAFTVPKGAIAVTGETKLERAVTLDGLYPDRVPPGASMQVVAVRPGGDVEPLVWLYEYSERERHPFLFRKPVMLPAGTVIRGVRADARILLIPVGGK